MDFTWINNDQGDITGVTATSPLTGGGTSGAITVGIQASSTTQSGAVQLTDSTSSTSTTTAATPNSVKTSYDLAAAAVPKSTVTTAGDVIYATGSGAVTRLGIGTSGQVLTVNSGATAPSWTTPASAGGLTLVTSQTIGSAVSSVTVTSAFSATYDNYLILVSGGVGSADSNLALTLGSTTTGYHYNSIYMLYSSATVNGENGQNTASFPRVGRGTTNSIDGEVLLKNPFNTKRTAAQWRTSSPIDGQLWAVGGGVLNDATSYTAFTLTPASGTLTGGTIRVYGYQNS
jgi:hypothetical protein